MSQRINRRHRRGEVTGLPQERKSPRYWEGAQTSVSVKDLFHAAKDTSFPGRFSPSLQKRLIKDVPLVPRSDAVLAWLDPSVLSEFGVEMGRFGLTKPADEAQILKALAVDVAKEGTPAQEHASATRYSDEGMPTHLSQSAERIRMGRWVLGDGRAGAVGRALKKVTVDAEGRTHVEHASMRIKGFPTHLKPEQDWEDVHTSGAQGAYWALEDLLLGEYLAANGVDIIRTPAEAFTTESFQFKIFGQTMTQDKGYELGLGQFDRLAHYNELWDDPKALRELMEDDGRLLAEKLGADRDFRLPELFQALTEQQAAAVVGTYWAKAAHGSPTVDNAGVLQMVDPATIVTVDRAHSDYALLSSVSEGYGHEPEQFLLPYYSEFLFRCFDRVATLEEKTELQKINPDTLVKQTLRRQMAQNLLMHLGIETGQAEALWRSKQPQVDTLLDVARTLGQQSVPGFTYELGEPAAQIANPARYDFFEALSVMARIQGSEMTRDEKIGALVEAMAPLDPSPERDRAAAEKLLDAAAPLFETMFVGTTKEIREALAGLMAEQAQRLNESVPKMYRSTLDAWSLGLYQELREGRISVTRFRAEIKAFLRDQIRRGPQSIPAVAARIHDGSLPKTEDGAWVLSRFDEYGVRIEELSDGVNDRVRFSLAPEALERGGLGAVKLRYTLDGLTYRELGPSGQDASGVWMWDVPVRSPALIQGSFFDPAHPDKRWDLDGLDFGIGHRPVLASPLIQAELALVAGQPRPGVSEAVQAAAALRRDHV